MTPSVTEDYADLEPDLLRLLKDLKKPASVLKVTGIIYPIVCVIWTLACCQRAKLKLPLINYPIISSPKMSLC